MKTWRDQTRKLKRVRRKPRRKCGSCGKPLGNPLGHVCAGGGGLGRKRRAAVAKAKRDKAAAAAKARRDAARARETAARRRRREREEEARRARRLREIEAAKARAARAKRKPPARRGRPQHDYRNCRDHDCERMACEAYREGRADEAEAQEAT